MKSKINILVVTAAVSFVQGLQLAISPLLNSISEHYSSVDISLIQMLITIPAFVSMFFSFISGWLVVKISKKKLLLFASCLAGVAGFLPFLADSFSLLFFSRALYGAALGWCVSLNTAVVSEFFEGDERVTVMGIQAASVGAGMLILSSVSGILGKGGYQRAFLINIIAFVAMIIIALCLPDTGKAKVKENEKIKLNKEVVEICIFVFFELLFLITFSTNISMHISGKMAGDSGISGILTGVYSGSQIIVGLILGLIAKITKKYILPTAMFCFSLGAFLLVLFPSNFIILLIASMLCGFSQGIYIPVGFVAVSNAVPAVAVAMVSACFNAAACVGQTISPYVINTISKMIFGESTTRGVYLVSAAGMTIVGVIHVIVKKGSDH